MPRKPERLTTTEAAELAGVTPGGLRGTLARLRNSGGPDLRAPEDEWPDKRTPMYDGTAFRAWLAERPGRRNWR